MSQVHALETSARTKPNAARSPSTLPKPVSVTLSEPSLATSLCPPKTVKTALTESMKPPTPVICDLGRTHTIARMGSPYIRIAVNAARITVTGTSCCGSSISSPAAFGSSKPT